MKHQGFSLLEILIVMAIIAMIVTISIPTFSGTKVRNRFNEERAILLDTLSDARANAVSSKNCEDNSSSNGWAFKVENTLNSGKMETTLQLLCKTQGTATFTPQAMEGQMSRLITKNDIITEVFLVGANDRSDPAKNFLLADKDNSGSIWVEYNDEGKQVTVRNGANDAFYKEAFIRLANTEINDTADLCIKISQGFPYRNDCGLSASEYTDPF